MGKVKCFRNIQCQICNIGGMLQVFYDSKGNPRYCRIRHYAGKGKFYYHKQDLEYIKQVLHSINQNNDHSGQNIIDLKLLNNCFITQNEWAGSSVWHERLTCTQEVGGSNPPRSTRLFNENDWS